MKRLLAITHDWLAKPGVGGLFLRKRTANVAPRSGRPKERLPEGLGGVDRAGCVQADDGLDVALVPPALPRLRPAAGCVLELHRIPATASWADDP